MIKVTFWTLKTNILQTKYTPNIINIYVKGNFIKLSLKIVIFTIER